MHSPELYLRRELPLLSRTSHVTGRAPIPPEGTPSRRHTNETSYDSKSTRILLEERLARERLRQDIASYSPLQVFRECLQVISRNTDRYGSLWSLLEDERTRMLQEHIDNGQPLRSHSSVKKQPPQLWNNLTETHFAHQRDVSVKRHQRVLKEELSEVKRELSSSVQESSRLQQVTEDQDERIQRLQQEIEDVKAQHRELTLETTRVKSELVKATEKNIQLQSINDAYAEADERKIGERHMKLLDEIERLREAEIEGGNVIDQLEALKKQHREELEKGEKSRIALEQKLDDNKILLKRVDAEYKTVSAQLQLMQMAGGGQLSQTDNPDDDTWVDSFIGKGNGLHLPKYLRWHGKLKNRKIKKGELERIIGDVWKEKLHYEINHGVTSLSTFFGVYMEQLVPCDPQRRSEKAYSLIYSAERYKADADCELFLAILREEVPEEVWLDQLQLLSELRAAFEERDIELNDSATGYLTHADIKEIISGGTISMLTSWRYQALCESLKRDCVTDEVPYLTLFASDKHGNQGEFVEELRDQHLHAVQAYIADICESVHELAVDEFVTWDHIRSAWLRIDPSIEPILDKTLAAVAKITRYPPPGEMEDLQIPFADFQNVFARLFVKRQGPDPTGGENKWNPALDIGMETESEGSDDELEKETDDPIILLPTATSQPSAKRKSKLTKKRGMSSSKFNKAPKQPSVLTSLKPRTSSIHS